MADIDNRVKTLANNITKQPPRDILFDFNQAYQKYSHSVHHFNNGVTMTTLEAHTLKHICQNEGVTLTDIVNYWGRTKGTVSAQISKLEEKGFVYRKKCEENGKVMHIYPTEKGLETNRALNRFYENETSVFLKKWFEKYTEEDMCKLMEMLQFYIDTVYADTNE